MDIVFDATVRVFCFLILFLRCTGMDKTGSVCGAQTLIADKSSGECERVCVCAHLDVYSQVWNKSACGCPL